MMDAATLGSPALSRAMVEAIRDPLLVLDVDLRVLVANGAFYRNFGVSPDDTQGKPVYQLGNGQWDIPALRTLLEDVLARQASFDGFEVAHDFPGLGRRVMLLNGRRIAPDGGRDALILLAIEDVTERKRADDLLARYREELERSNTDLEQFAYVASHDLQEPLRMVSSYAQLLARRYRGRLDPDADDFIAYVVDGANRMKVLINDLLSYSRLGVGDLQRVPVAFDGALDRVLESLEGAIEESGAVITRTALPSVVCDASQIGQLLQNLLSNAIKFHGP
ncbi:MAG TPA: PAS domain-containing protein, partial [Planctomycetota bacterium]|nr:PAS domain-containing protein [Planctomycetota bacterium]